MTDYQKRWVKDNPDKVRAAQKRYREKIKASPRKRKQERAKSRKRLRNYYRNRRQKYIDILGGQCVSCGSKRSLQFDHIKPEEKEFDISPWGMRYPESKVLPELMKCQLLCESCHKKKTYPPPRHGTNTMYNRYGCRCDACYNFNHEFRQYDNKREYRRVNGTR